ncbi:hypothetical protein LUZ60_014160 [Juncus effusus]|nr:hypothetical protein LUZ60_014160 [Juncus effusus]
MEMEAELEPRAKPLLYKVKSTSRESPSQKAVHVLDSDLRSHWSTATNTKEWILLELDEPCLLSHIRIYNKSVLEWEITAGLKYKPEAFVKVRTRCEAPRRDMMYHMNYTPCKFVRISCLRGNPIAIFFIQLFGVSVPGLEPELQPVVNYFLPHIISHKQDTHDLHLQLLQDISSKLGPFLPNLENDLNGDVNENTVKFLAMLAGPFYPILQLVIERDGLKLSINNSETDTSKSQSSAPTLLVSSNFELLQPRRARITSLNQPDFKSIAFRSDAIIILSKKAFNDKNLGIICRKVAIILQSLVDPISNSENEVVNKVCIGDYSNIFGDEFRVLEGCDNPNYLNLLDISAIEEALLHILYSSASQAQICAKLAENNSEMWSVLPLIQALLPALRPSVSNSSSDQIDENFNQWNQNSVQHALSEIVMMTSAIDCKPLIRACAGYLSSYSLLHAKTACVLIDLCTGPLYPWIPTIIAKVDLTIEVLSDMLGIIQAARQYFNRSKAALKYVILAISGHMDDLLPQYKDSKHKILFLIEMLDPFLSTISFGGVSDAFSEKDEMVCEIALNVIRTGVAKPLVLPSLEREWREKTVSPSVLLSILDPHMTFPPEMDLSVNPSNPNSDHFEETEENSLFAPTELKQLTLTNPKMETLNFPEKPNSDQNAQIRNPNSQIFSLDDSFSADYYQTKADYLQLINYQDCESRSSEFRQLAIELCNKNDLNIEAFNAGIDALLLAAECFVNPFFLVSFKPDSDLLNRINKIKEKLIKGTDLLELRKDFMKKKMDLVTVSSLENKRDKAVLDILLQAAKLYNEYHKRDNSNNNNNDNNGFFIEISEADSNSLDAVTLVRNNQELLCEFIISQFKRENNNSSHEILLQSLLFLLRSATKLFCQPDDVINIIASSAANLNSQLTSFYHKFKSNSFQNLEIEELYLFKKKWNLLQKLVTVSSENDYKNLIPFNSWMENIKKFRKLNQPLARFLFWSAVSNYSKECSKERILIASDFRQLSDLLSIFSDEILLTDKSDSFQVLYPDLYLFFPKMSEKFRSFGEKILEAIGLQIKCMPKNYIPDILTWFSEICIWPYSNNNNNNININAKACVLYILESIVSEHMEAIIPEMPRVAHILVSLSKATFADVAFLDSVLSLLKPLISYFLKKSTKEEELLAEKVNQDFELTSFEELFDIIKDKKEEENEIQMPLIIFILGYIFPDLSFKRKSWILKSLLIWADFTLLDSSNSFYGYLCAFQRLTESCHSVLIQNLELFGIKFKTSNSNSNSNLDQDRNVLRLEEEFGLINKISCDNNDKRTEIENFLVSLDDLINKIIPQIESSWKLHRQLAVKLSHSISQCVLLSRCLNYSILNNKDNISDESNIWSTALEGLVRVILITVKKQCWQVGSAMLDFLLNLNNKNEFHYSFNLNKKEIVSGLFSSIKLFCLHAPKISMRLKTEKWLSLLFNTEFELSENESTGVALSLADLFNTMLSHPEPEQKSIALKQIAKIINNNENNKNMLPNLVSKIWDEIVKIALSDDSFLLRKHAMVILSEILPFLERGKIQAFLQSSDLILGNSGKFLMRLSVLLLGNACVYSPDEDICLIPLSVWSNLESMRDSYTGGISDLEKDLCRALCQLRTESSAKSDLKEVLSSGAAEKPIDPGFVTVRETVLQVLSSLTCVESYFDFFSRNSEEESQELEEAEIEMELIQNELSDKNRETDSFNLCYKDESKKPNERLEQIKDGIKSLEKSKLREEIIMRRQKKLLMRQERQKHLEELTQRETELLQELDREKAAESEREIERKRQLELERAKTRELQFNLDLEREKLNQREIQKELEQVESGVRPSRRDFSSSRPRDRERDRERYRERDDRYTDRAEINGPNAPTVMHRSVSASSSSQTNPTVILQSRDRSDGGYDSGDANSVGEPEFEVYGGPGPRRTGAGSRGGGPRVPAGGVERRDRGKWERKH